jgi:hypothetical protein
MDVIYYNCVGKFGLRKLFRPDTIGSLMNSSSSLLLSNGMEILVVDIEKATLTVGGIVT